MDSTDHQPGRLQRGGWESGVETSGYPEQRSFTHPEYHEKGACFLPQLHPCCIQGSPGCTAIFALQVPFFLFRWWSNFCQVICHLIWWVRSTSLTQSDYHRFLLSYHGIYIHQNLQVTWWNRSVTWRVRTAPGSDTFFYQNSDTSPVPAVSSQRRASLPWSGPDASEKMEVVLIQYDTKCTSGGKSFSIRQAYVFLSNNFA